MHDHYDEAKKSILYGIILNSIFTVIELVGGILSNSLALLSDTIHDFSDSVALGISYYANQKAQSSPTKNMTFGYRRTTILAALINSTVLILLTFFIFYRAYLRILNPEPVDGKMVFVIAVFGIITNGAIAFKMLKGKDKDLNIKSVFWHITEDFLGWVGVLIAGAVISLTGFYMIDPIISILIGLIVIYSAWGIFKESLNIILEGVPEGIDVNDIESEIRNIENVNNVHDLHVWSLGTNYNALSAHVVISDMTVDQSHEILNNINSILKEKFNIKHTTIEFECSHCDSNRVCY
ncbi:MAG: cation diffusion facilitator family transporter [Candidatus Methanofastidiosum sp.]|nr:cation diffusion facilitator family transporter [Methanofastidiosum sp.]